MLDPFAGIGTALFAAGALGTRAEGIELLPIGQRVITTRHLLEWDMRPGDIGRLARWPAERPSENSNGTLPINELRITKGAYPLPTLESAGRYLAALRHENERVRAVLLFALLCILEVVSYTRKDGQYLRGGTIAPGDAKEKRIFDKGAILPFDRAITEKLVEIVHDLRAPAASEDLFRAARVGADVTLHSGSCLTIMPKLAGDSYDCIMTSPPYCNRYDYTRTYALKPCTVRR